MAGYPHPFCHVPEGLEARGDLRGRTRHDAGVFRGDFRQGVYILKRLFIIGAGGFGREVFSWIQQIPNRDREWAFGGFLDDDYLNATKGHR